MTHRSRPLLWLTIFVGLALFSTAASVPATESPQPRIWGLERGVSDVDSAIAFYTAALGFEVVSQESDGTWALLHNGTARLALVLSDAPVAGDDSPRVYPNFSVGGLDATAGAVVAAGGSVAGTPRTTPVGSALAIRDPFGHPANLIDHPWDEKAADSPPEIFNFGLRVESVATAETFLTALGLTVQTRDYLPQTLVFAPQGVAQLVVHPVAAQAVAPLTDAGALWLDADPGDVLAALNETQRRGARATPAIPPATGSTVDLRGPSGNLFKIARRSPSDRDYDAEISAEEATAAFEHLKSLAGDWRAKSTRGWDEVVTYEVVAGGSVVMETNTFADAPDNTMYTMFHLDGARLLATHYCASGNQPRLMATAIADDGKRVTFTYLDSTGLPSRDHGHMDQAVFRFLNQDTFTSKWTWYAKGNEQWMEEIEHRRARSPEVATGR